jgi:flagellar M-ring protein FliF
VPGALSNQPTAPATAPLTGGGATNPNATAAAAGGAAGGAGARRESLTNYEVDKTVRHVTTPTGVLKRLSAAIVVNHKKLPPAKPGGVATSMPLSADEVTQINALVKEAIGFSKDRGDSINVVNAAFTPPTIEKLPDVPIWKEPETIQTAKEFARYGGIALIVLLVFFGVLRPLMRQIAGPPRSAEAEAAEEETPVTMDANGQPVALPAPPGNLDKARALAKQDPRIVANVVRNWVNRDE